MTTSGAEMANERELNEKAEASQNRRATEEMLRAQYKGMPVPTYSWKWNGDDFVLVDYNDAAIEITKGGITDFVGRTAREMYGEMPEVLDEFRRCFTDKTSIQREILYTFKTTGDARHLLVTYIYVPPDLVMVHTEDITERRKAQMALAESEERYRSLVESARESIFTIDRHGTFLFMNDIAAARLGGVPEDFVRKTMWEIFPDHVAKKQMASVSEVFESGEGLMSETVTELRGRKLEYTTTLQPIRDHSGRIASVVGIARDSTDRKLAEEKAEHAHFETNQIFEAATPMNVIDRDFNMLRINDTFSALFQVKREEVIGKKCYDLWPGPLCRTSKCPLERILDGREYHEYEDNVKLPDGTEISSLVSAFPYRGPDGEILGIVESFTDITDRKKTEERLRLSEEKFRELADLLPQTVFEVDREGNLTFANRHSFEFTGYTPEDLDSGLNIFQLFVSDDRRMIEDRIPRLLAGEVFGGSEYALIRKDGNAVPVIIYSSRIVRDGETVGLRGIVIDNTERKTAENELRIAYDKLKEEQRRLVDTNIALREVLGQIDAEKKEMKRRIQASIDRLVLPILHTLQANASVEDKVYLDMIEKNLEDLAVPFVSALEKRARNLTPKEILICKMIIDELSSKEIAVCLNISVLTVHKFRQHIRKKLGLTNTKENLISILRSIRDDLFENNE
jgi:PAS domain S-box-containing protein